MDIGDLEGPVPADVDSRLRRANNGGARSETE